MTPEILWWVNVIGLGCSMLGLTGGTASYILVSRIEGRSAIFPIILMVWNAIGVAVNGALLIERSL